MNHYFTNNENLKSEFRTINFSYKSTPFAFLSDNGVFSKNEIDYGSLTLLNTFLEREKTGRVLDLGCGYGFLGIVISKINNSEVVMCDINKRAVHLTNMNIEKNKVNAKAIVSDAYENIDGKYDLIITNPPIRAGKNKVLEILLGAKDYLSNGGKLYYVIRKDQGSKSISKLLEETYEITLLKKDKGFYVYLAIIRWLVYKNLLKLYIAIHVCFLTTHSYLDLKDWGDKIGLQSRKIWRP